MPMDELRTECIVGLLGTGYEGRIMLSHDTVNVWLGRPPVFPEEAEELLANWHITHLFDNVLPVLKKAGITNEQLDGIFFEKPKRLFGS